MTETGSGVVYDGVPLDGVELAVRGLDGVGLLPPSRGRGRDPRTCSDVVPLLPRRRHGTGGRS